MFYAVRHSLSGKLLVKQNWGVGMFYVPTASTPDDVEHLQHLVTFKTVEQAEKFIDQFRHNIVAPFYSSICPIDYEQLELVPLEVSLGW